MARETIEEYKKRGGIIKNIEPYTPAYISHKTHYRFKDLEDQKDTESPAWKSHGETWCHHATAPGGRIEPGPRSKTWSNHKKTSCT